MKKQTTFGLYIGSVEAEQEVNNPTLNIGAFFEDYTNINRAISLGKFIICGRKGSGKSAYAVWQNRNTSVQDQRFVSIVKKDEFALEELRTKPENGDVDYRILFEWIILVRIVKLIISSEIKQEHKEIKALNRFYHQNSGWASIDKFTVNEIVGGKEVNFSPLKNDVAEFKLIKTQKATQAPFYRLIEPLRDALIRILRWETFQKSDIKVIFDDLDLKFKLSSDADKQMLLSLIRVAKRYNTEYFNQTPAKIILLVRDDIVDKLSGTDCDVAKTLNGSSYTIKWYENDKFGDGRNSLLRKLINRRLRLAFDANGLTLNTPEDPWNSFVIPEIQNKPSFKHILDYTFYLPRDIVSIFQNIGLKRYELPLNEQSISELIEEFSRMKYAEIVDELTVAYTKEQIDAIFDSLCQINNGYGVSYDKAIAILNEHGFDKTTLIILIDYNLIIPVDPNKNHLFFTYREKVPQGSLSQYTYRTPYILSTYFKIR